MLSFETDTQGKHTESKCEPHREHDDNLLFLMAFILSSLCRSDICMCDLLDKCVCVWESVKETLPYYYTGEICTLSPQSDSVHLILVPLNFNRHKLCYKEVGKCNSRFLFEWSHRVRQASWYEKTTSARSICALCKCVHTGLAHLTSRFLSDTADPCVYSSLWPSRHDTFTADINTMAMQNHHAPLR